MRTVLKNILVQYRGGGYDGCLWEWNYFYIDHDGEFHDIQSSGYDGCGNAENADDMLKQNHDHTYTYDVTEPADIAEFSRKSNSVHIKGVLQWFNDHDIPFYTACTDCGNIIEWAEDLTLENWHGCGGIAVTADTLLCTDCFSAGQCYCCNEYVGQSGFDYEQDWNGCLEEIQAELECWEDDNGPVCQYCWEGERDNLIADEQQNQLTASLATGTPDLFSDDMRWFWNKLIGG